MSNSPHSTLIDLSDSWGDREHGAASKFLSQHRLVKGQYAGIVQGEGGEPDYHLFLLPGEAERVNWIRAMEWAAKRGAALPNLREQALLRTKLPLEFNTRRRYWSREPFTPTSSHARGTNFRQGDQFIFHKSYRGSSRAVRRVPIDPTTYQIEPTCA